MLPLIVVESDPDWNRKYFAILYAPSTGTLFGPLTRWNKIAVVTFAALGPEAVNSIAPALSEEAIREIVSPANELVGGFAGAGIREKAERVAQKLEAVGVTSRRLGQSIELMKSIEQDYRDLRYEDAARRRRVALGQLHTALTDDLDQTTGLALSRARQLPAAMREEILQASDDAYPPGYEDLLKSYFRTLSETR